MLLLNTLHVLSPFRGLLLFCNSIPGVLRFAQAQAEYTPVCGLSRLDFVDLWFGAYLADSNTWKLLLSGKSMRTPIDAPIHRLS